MADRAQLILTATQVITSGGLGAFRAGTEQFKAQHCLEVEGLRVNPRIQQLDKPDQKHRINNYSLAIARFVSARRVGQLCVGAAQREPALG